MSFEGLALVLFIYGLAFFGLGLTALLERSRAKVAHFESNLLALAGFAFIHCAHEWIELFGHLGLLETSGSHSANAGRLAVLGGSFVFLAVFAAGLFRPLRSRRATIAIVVVLTGLGAAGAVVTAAAMDPASAWRTTDLGVRYLIGAPAAILGGVGLIRHARSNDIRPSRTAGHVAGWVLILYGVAQIIGPEGGLPPSRWLNQDLVLQALGVPIQLVRGILAVVFAASITLLLRTAETEVRARQSDSQRDMVSSARQSALRNRELWSRIVTAQEDERQRIARELHDETGQALTAISVGLRSIAKAVPEQTQDIANLFVDLDRLVDDSLAGLSRVVMDLRPPQLDDLGLSAALEWQVGAIGSRASLDTSFRVSGDEPPLSSTIMTAVFRIVQEALTNVVRHADASTVSVRIAYRDGEVECSVEDDGRGFVTEPSALIERRFGILGMRERAELLDGELALQSAPGAGTRLRVRIPVAENGSDASKSDLGQGQR